MTVLKDNPQRKRSLPLKQRVLLAKEDIRYINKVIEFFDKFSNNGEKPISSSYRHKLNSLDSKIQTLINDKKLLENTLESERKELSNLLSPMIDEAKKNFINSQAKENVLSDLYEFNFLPIKDESTRNSLSLNDVHKYLCDYLSENLRKYCYAKRVSLLHEKVKADALIEAYLDPLSEYYEAKLRQKEIKACEITARKNFFVKLFRASTKAEYYKNRYRESYELLQNDLLSKLGSDKKTKLQGLLTNLLNTHEELCQLRPYFDIEDIKMFVDGAEQQKIAKKIIINIKRLKALFKDLPYKDARGRENSWAEISTSFKRLNKHQAKANFSENIKTITDLLLLESEQMTLYMQFLDLGSENMDRNDLIYRIEDVLKYNLLIVSANKLESFLYETFTPEENGGKRAPKFLAFSKIFADYRQEVEIRAAEKAANMKISKDEIRSGVTNLEHIDQVITKCDQAWEKHQSMLPKIWSNTRLQDILNPEDIREHVLNELNDKVINDTTYDPQDLSLFKDIDKYPLVLSNEHRSRLDELLQEASIQSNYFNEAIVPKINKLFLDNYTDDDLTDKQKEIVKQLDNPENKSIDNFYQDIFETKYSSIDSHLLDKALSKASLGHKDKLNLKAKSILKIRESLTNRQDEIARLDQERTNLKEQYKATNETLFKLLKYQIISASTIYVKNKQKHSVKARNRIDLFLRGVQKSNNYQGLCDEVGKLFKQFKNQGYALRHDSYITELMRRFYNENDGVINVAQRIYENLSLQKFDQTAQYIDQINTAFSSIYTIEKEIDISLTDAKHASECTPDKLIADGNEDMLKFPVDIMLHCLKNHKIDNPVVKNSPKPSYVASKFACFPVIGRLFNRGITRVAPQQSMGANPVNNDGQTLLSGLDVSFLNKGVRGSRWWKLPIIHFFVGKFIGKSLERKPPAAKKLFCNTCYFFDREKTGLELVNRQAPDIQI